MSCVNLRTWQKNIKSTLRWRNKNWPYYNILVLWMNDKINFDCIDGILRIGPKTVNPSIMRFRFLINATHLGHKLICKDVIEGNAILWRSYIWPKFATSVDILQFINPLIICKKSGVKTLFQLLDIFSNQWNKFFFDIFIALYFPIFLIYRLKYFQR